MVNILLASEEVASNLGVMNSEVLAAIISAIVSVCIGLISGLLTAHKAKMNFYSSTVSKERVDWINRTRDITSKLVAFCAVHSEDELSSVDLLQFEDLRSSLLLRLSPKEYIEEKNKYKDTDGELIKILEQEEYSKVRVQKNEIRRIVTIICKNEWNRIKAEAGGNKDIEKTIKKYDESVENTNKKTKK